MASTSNIYAEKIFSEHPIQLWALDEKVDFVSYLNSSEKDLSSSNWSKSGVGSSTVTTENSPPTPLPISETSYKVSNAAATSFTITSVAKSINGSTVSFYFNPTTDLLTSIDIQVGSETIQTQTVTSDMVNNWNFVSKTFSDATFSNVTLKITFNYSGTTTNDTYINGLSWGYDSENFNVSSTGIVPTSLPSNVTYGTKYAWTGTANASTSTKILNGYSTTNLITNPDFETNANDWLTNSITVSRDTSQYFIGSASLKLIVNGTDPYAVNIPGGVSNSRTAVVPGKTYTFSFYIKNGTSLNKWAAQIKGYNTSSFAFGFISSYDGAPTSISTTDWTRLYVTWTIPNEVTYVETRVATVADTSNAVVYIDAVLLEESPILNNYINPNIKTNLATNPNFEASSGTVNVRINNFINPSAEVDASSWGANLATIARITTDAYSGSSSIEATYAGTAGDIWVSPTSSGLLPVVAGQPYTFSVYVKDVSTAKTFQVGLDWYTGTPAYISSNSSAFVTVSTSAWTRISVTGTAPSTATQVGFRIRANDTPITGTKARFDAALFEQSATLGNYFDGSTTASGDFTYAWSGTANASTSYQIAKGLANWGVATISNGVIYQSTEQKYLGSASAIVKQGNNYTFARLNGKIISTPPGTYTLSAWVYSSASKIDIVFRDNGGYAFYQKLITPNTWTRITQTVVQSGSSAIWDIGWEQSEATEGTIAYLDAVLLEQSSTVNDYFDGSFAYQLYSTPAYPYGKQNALSNTAYYLTNTSKLYAKNTSVPMAYGGNNATIISPNYNSISSETYPSLIIPGQGFMNESGKNKDLTFESWFRIGSAPSTAKRIFGPIGSTDGLYVDGPFFRLKVGNKLASKYVGEWARPMLIQIYIGFNIVKMFLNGEEVISFNIDTNATTFSLENVYGKDNTFLGFYAYSDTSNIEIDSVAIYPYAVNSVLAMRRWIYGQAVEFKQNLNYLYNGKTAITDYAFSNYSNNYNYPKTSKCNTGTFQNIKIENDTLSSPDYSLPDYYIGSELKTLSLNGADSLGAFTRVDTNGKLIFSSINQLKVDTRSLYGIFKRIESSSSNQILFYMINNDTQEYFKIFINQSTIYYNVKLNSSASEINLYSVSTASETFVAGFDIDRLISNSPENISNLFSNLNNLKLYIAGSPTENSFSGNIYKIGFASTYDTSLIFDYFGSNGIINSSLDSETTYDADLYNTSSWTNTFDAGTYSTTSWDSTVSASILQGLNSYVPSYLLTVSSLLNSLYLDIQSTSYWQESIPLSRFAKYVKNSNGDDAYEVDFIQLNIDYPEPIIPLTGNIDTSNSLVKTYIYFQKINGINETDLNSILTIQNLNNECVVVPDTNWKNKKYEVVNGTIIYMPSNFDSEEDFSNYAITVSIVMSNPGILNNPIQVRSLELASKSLDYSKSNPIPTKLGNELVPYNDSTGTRNYKIKNPIRIYKKSSPHLYLSKHSGIKVSGDSSFGSVGTRGYYMSASTNSLNIDGHDQNIGSIQIVLRWNYETFPNSETEIFRINSTIGVIVFYLSASSTFLNRRKIIAKLNNLEYTQSIKYYWNGIEVLNPIIKPNEWGILGINFLKGIGIDDSSSINVTGNMLINNISYYKLTDLQLGQKRYVENSWNTVKNYTNWTTAITVTSTFDGTWGNVYSKLVSYLPDVNSIEIYNSYTGSNKNNLVNESLSNKTMLSKSQYSVYSGISNKPIDFDIA